MTQLTELNKISIADLCFYVPALAVAVVLCLRHGFLRSAGWIYLIFFSLMRIIGSSFQLATIAHPDNLSLYIGAQILLGVGLSPLVLVLLGLESRVLSSIPKDRRPAAPTPLMMRLMQLIIVVGLVLTIVGGSDTGNHVADQIDNGTALSAVSYTISPLTKAGMALMIVGYGLLVVAGALLALRLRDVPQGERRLLLAVAAALPFVLVRLLFSTLSTFDPTNPGFRQYGGGNRYDSYLVGMCTVMEMVSVVIFEGVGLSLASNQSKTVTTPESSGDDVQK